MATIAGTSQQQTCGGDGIVTLSNYSDSTCTGTSTNTTSVIIGTGCIGSIQSGCGFIAPVAAASRCMALSSLLFIFVFLFYLII